VSNAVQTVAAADKGISAITKLVESAQATARQALQTAATVETTTAATAGTNTLTFGSALTFDGDDAINFDITVDGGTAQSISIAQADVQAAGDADSVIDDADELVEILNGKITGATAANNAGTITITSATTGTTSSVAISNTAVVDTNTSGFTNTSGIADGAGTAGAAAVTTSSTNPKRAELVDTYNDLLEQIDDLAKDASFNGVNLLGGDSLSVLFNEDGTSKLDITGVTDNAAGLGLTALATTAFDTNASINATLDDLKAGIETLRSQSAKFGSNLSVVETRQDFTKNMISVLQTGAANLTLADTNEEAANVLALQTRQQLSSTALSLASQADQNVLRLF
jgi:hypothetical protein